MDNKLDHIDLKMIAILQVDGRISITDLAEKIGLSKTPTQQRLKHLMTSGIVTGFRAILDTSKLDLDHVAFVEVKLSDTREDALKKFNVASRKISEIEECHMIAGAFDYLLKVRTKDIKTYRAVLGEKISSLPYVASTSTFVVMQAVKER